MWIKTLQVRLLIITLSLYRKRAKNIYIINFHWQSRVQALSKTPIKITEAVYTMKLISLLFLTRENSQERGIQSASKWRKHQHFSDDSSERLWLVTALISSTAWCVIGYNAQCCKTRLSLAQRQPANADLNLAADRRTERYNLSSIFCLLEAAFKIHLAQKYDAFVIYIYIYIYILFHLNEKKPIHWH